MVSQNDGPGTSYKSATIATTQSDKKLTDALLLNVSQPLQQRPSGYASAVINGGVVQYSANNTSVVWIFLF